jgi:hypothetical protein
MRYHDINGSRTLEEGLLVCEPLNNAHATEKFLNKTCTSIGPSHGTLTDLELVCHCSFLNRSQDNKKEKSGERRWSKLHALSDQTITPYKNKLCRRRTCSRRMMRQTNTWIGAVQNASCMHIINYFWLTHMMYESRTKPLGTVIYPRDIGTYMIYKRRVWMCRSSGRSEENASLIN